MRTILKAAAVLAFLFAFPAAANQYTNPNGSISNGFVPEDGAGNVLGGYSYANINTATTVTLKSGAGILHSICLNTIAAASTAQIWDSLTAAGAKIGLITQATGQQPSCLIYDVVFKTGLTIVTVAGTPDYTVSFR